MGGPAVGRPKILLPVGSRLHCQMSGGDAEEKKDGDGGGGVKREGESVEVGAA